MAARFLITGGGSVTWDASNTAIWSASSGGATGASVPVDGDTVTMDGSSGGGTVTLGYDPTVTSITMGAFTGTFNASTFSPTMDTFNCSGTGVRTLSMGSGTWTLRGNNATIWNVATTTNLTLNVGTSIVNCTYAGSTGTRTITTGGTAALGLNTFKVSAGTDIVQTSANAFFCVDFDLTGFTGTLANATNPTIAGNFTLGTGMTATSGSTATVFTAASSKTLNTNGVQYNRSLTFNGVGGAWTLQGALDCSGADNTRVMTLTNGTFNANGYNVTTPQFSSSNSNTRTLTMGSGTWTLTGSGATIFNVGTVTNLTFTKGANPVSCTYSGGTGTRSIAFGSLGGSATLASYPDFAITAGTDTVGIGTSRVGAVDFTGFSGTFSNGTRVFYGNVTISSGMTLSAGASATTLAAEGSDVQTITSSGKTFDFPITAGLQSTSTGSVVFGDAFTMGATRTLTHTAGTINANNKNVSVGLFSSSNSNTRAITMGSGTWTLTGTGTVWTTATTTNLTLTPSTSTIVISDTSATGKTFTGGGLTFGNITFSGDNITVAGSNTFANFNLNTAGLTNGLLLTAGTTQTVSNFFTNGSSGNLAILLSTSAGSAATLSKASGTVSANYMSLKDSAAIGGAAWYAGANTTNVSGNSGWIFSNAPGGGIVGGMRNAISNAIMI